jgi:hypothetical protein
MADLTGVGLSAAFRNHGTAASALRASMCTWRSRATALHSPHLAAASDVAGSASLACAPEHCGSGSVYLLPLRIALQCVSQHHVADTSRSLDRTHSTTDAQYIVGNIAAQACTCGIAGQRKGACMMCAGRCRAGAHVFGELPTGLGQGVPINRTQPAVVHVFTLSSHTTQYTMCLESILRQYSEVQGLCDSMQADVVSHPPSTKSLPSSGESIAVGPLLQALNLSCAAL